jgi:hypothetical protein
VIELITPRCSSSVIIFTLRGSFAQLLKAQEHQREKSKWSKPTLQTQPQASQVALPLKHKSEDSVAEVVAAEVAEASGLLQT